MLSDESRIIVDDIPSFAFNLFRRKRMKILGKYSNKIDHREFGVVILNLIAVGPYVGFSY